MMHKKEACSMLGCAPRTLENYVKRGLLSVRYEKGKFGDVAVYDPIEVESLKTKLAEPSMPVRPTVLAAQSGSQALVPTQSGVSDLAAVFASFANARRAVPIDRKLTLSLVEASAYSGLSEQRLRVALRSGSLKGKGGGGSPWIIRRADLESWVASWE